LNLRNFLIGASAFVIGSCAQASKNSIDEYIKTHPVAEEIMILESERVNSIQKIMNNVVQINIYTNGKRDFITFEDISRQIGDKVRERILRLYDGTKTDEIVKKLLEDNMRNINMKIAFSNVRGDYEGDGTGFVYKTCRGDVLFTSHHLISPRKFSYITNYGGVLANIQIKSREVFYNGRKINLEELILLNKPEIDLVITKVPGNFEKETYPIVLAKNYELKSGEKVIKMGNTSGEGIQVSSGVISYNGTMEGKILGEKIDVYVLSLPASGGDSGSPVLLERSLKLVGKILSTDNTGDALSVPMRTYVLPAEKIIGELRRISPYDECNYD
jgi:S1-C subfamily serine protease